MEIKIDIDTKLTKILRQNKNATMPFHSPIQKKYGREFVSPFLFLLKIVQEQSHLLHHEFHSQGRIQTGNSSVQTL